MTNYIIEFSKWYWYIEYILQHNTEIIEEWRIAAVILGKDELSLFMYKHAANEYIEANRIDWNFIIDGCDWVYERIELRQIVYFLSRQETNELLQDMRALNNKIHSYTLGYLEEQRNKYYLNNKPHIRAMEETLIAKKEDLKNFLLDIMYNGKK